MKLKQCPFCGGEARLADFGSKEEIFITDATYDSENGDNPVICCSVCGAEVAQSPLPSKLAEQWNTRKAEDINEKFRIFVSDLFFVHIHKMSRNEPIDMMALMRQCLEVGKSLFESGR